MTSAETLFQSALKHHHARRLREAESGYRRVLAEQPAHSPALHMLGVLAAEAGQPEVAVALLKRAAVAQPGSAAIYSDLGSALWTMGRVQEALEACRESVRLQPESPEALNNLGALLCEAGERDEAVRLCREAVRLRPDYQDAQCNLGNALQAGGQLDAAISAYRRCLEIDSAHAKAWDGLGCALKKAGRAGEAVAALRSALELDPANAQTCTNLGAALLDGGQIAEAVRLDSRAIELLPTSAQAWCNLGDALQASGRLDEAIAASREALRLDPTCAPAANNLGSALHANGEIDEAMAALRRALELQPNLAEAHNNLGNCLKDLGQIDPASSSFRAAMALNSGNARFHSNLIYTLYYHPSFDAVSIAEEHRHWNRRFADPLRKHVAAHLNPRDPERRLRVGYVSPDFWAQAESHFVVPLLEAHDHSRYEIHCYASVGRPDAITERLRKSADVWHDVLGVPNVDLAEKIRGDGIDILVDLTMHMAGNRLQTFACKPAPVQVTWLAYPGSTGLETIDYRITDRFMDPPEFGVEGYSEESYRMPDSWCCYAPLIDLPAVAPETSHWGKFVRFGSLNNPCKFNDEVFGAWARILLETGDSRLLLLTSSETSRQAIRQQFAILGVAGERLEFAGKCSRKDYLNRYREIDIALDPLPYGGITTTCDALWMGVPVVSLTGRTAASRIGRSLLTTAGLPELAAQTPDECVRIAADLARDLPRLADLRANLRTRLEASPLFDWPGFTRHFEDAYRWMWRRWCAKPEMT